MPQHDVFSGRVVFDHLPKTAGQAINAWLLDRLGAGCVMPNADGNHRDMIRQYGGRYSVLSGHLDFRKGEGLDPRYQYLAIVREPVERAVSWLHYLVHNNELPHLEGLSKLARSFLESNGGDIPGELRPFISDYYVNHFCLVVDDNDGDDEQKLGNALRAIRQYDVVGLYTNMPGFLANAAALFGLPAPTELPRVNVTLHRPKVEDISPALRERIIALNQLDLRFYREMEQWLTVREKNEADLRQPAAALQPRRYDPPTNRVVCSPDIIVCPAVLRGTSDVSFGDILTFEVDFLLMRDVEGLNIGIHIYDDEQRLAFGTSTVLQGASLGGFRQGSHRVNYTVRATLPGGRYSVGFAFVERRQDQWRELAWFDTMCKFRVVHPAGKRSIGFADLPAAIKVASTRVAAPDAVVLQPIGHIAVSKQPHAMNCGQSTHIAVEIHNRCAQVWLGDKFRPVNLSHHWYKACGEVWNIDGLRTPLPPQGVMPGRSVTLDMLVQAPNQPGHYILELTLVQEHIGWFENMGFQATRLSIEVMP